MMKVVLGVVVSLLCVACSAFSDTYSATITNITAVPEGIVLRWIPGASNSLVRWSPSLEEDFSNLVELPFSQAAYTDIVHTLSDQGFYRIELISFRDMVTIPGGVNSGTDPDAGTYSLSVNTFYMDRTEVSRVAWDAVYNWAIAHDYSLVRGLSDSPNHPMHYVSWFDCVKWCNARSEMEGLTPCYTVNGSVYRTGKVIPDCDFNASGYRLPTEIEWEYAARGGLSGYRFPWGDTISHSEANYFSSSSYSYDISPTREQHPVYDGAAPVGTFSPNGYGLYNMAGNVSEWCWDEGIVNEPATRRRMGGNAGWFANIARCHYKEWNYGTYALNRIGFRTVRNTD